ncbi:hypothetical protein SAMN05216257_10577 [Meinhardsimonia xiamenensis]|jgi:hypothetical protein|uniref:DUF475 domain-containing protein n=1 Tax=Meinhardsimonia xiamenensis TaxID=990712 RepID=A0A1G9F8D2_9RHOB|nr:DUF475 domain-containing protein [Meinhardsimonia xiamenensis]PRX37953.1 hypothetical protein LV81_00226 [Meinhardsimonia xiamenensis]SDK84453.1 hypothetical protein SAMN05216257_10577 [Meinhardsimonia xiamenensis]
MTTAMRYFRWAFAVTALGIVLAGWLGWVTHGTLSGVIAFLVIGVVLAALEISLSFDNAIVNANRLKTMSPVWQQRFLTWGILIAVFGMRIVFPLAVVAFAARLGPLAAVELAAVKPQEYARIMNEAHLSIAAFGGAFLMMVALNYFIDEGKEVHWIHALETRLRRLAPIRGMQITVVLVVLLAFASRLPEAKKAEFLFAGLLGLVVFTVVEIASHLLDSRDRALAAAGRSGLGGFLYLEVLDASFSFDGVIGAFALTQNLFLIAIGLGVGAMYVRSMTIMLVERQTLTQFRFLEHGAFYSIFALALIMFAQSMVHIPELVTGFIGAGLIGTALWSSVCWNRRNGAALSGRPETAGE